MLNFFILPSGVNALRGHLFAYAIDVASVETSAARAVCEPRPTKASVSQTPSGARDTFCTLMPDTPCGRIFQTLKPKRVRSDFQNTTVGSRVEVLKRLPESAIVGDDVRPRGCVLAEVRRIDARASKVEALAGFE